MKVKMLQTRRGTEDGFKMRQYFEGKTYDLRDNLARYFLMSKYAVKTSE